MQPAAHDFHFFGNFCDQGLEWSGHDGVFSPCWHFLFFVSPQDPYAASQPIPHDKQAWGVAFSTSFIPIIPTPVLSRYLGITYPGRRADCRPGHELSGQYAGPGTAEPSFTGTVSLERASTFRGLNQHQASPAK
jgi:hypothetical protein